MCHQYIVFVSGKKQYFTESKRYNCKFVLTLLCKAILFPVNFVLIEYFMQRKKVDVDVVKDVLELMMAARPDSAFIKSLHHQYLERGGLSKKQLEGLHQKAAKVPGIPASKLATIEAIILKKVTRDRSKPSVTATPVFQQDEQVNKIIQHILSKYPHHKRVLFFKAKYDNREPLTNTEIGELKKFEKIMF